MRRAPRTLWDMRSVAPRAATPARVRVPGALIGIALCLTHATAPAQDSGVAPPKPDTCGAEFQSRVRLSGTLYNARHPERSMAMLGAASSRETAVYRTGSSIGDYRLLEVRPRAVLLGTEHDSPCWLRMARVSPRAPEPPRESRKKKSQRTAFSREELDQSIQRLRDDVYRVDRKLIEQAIARAAILAKRTRTRTVQDHGVPVGLSLVRIPGSGLLSALGLRRGDVLKTLNGLQVASLDGMLRARTQLASAPRLSLALLRDGRQITLEYQLH